MATINYCNYEIKGTLTTTSTITAGGIITAPGGNSTQWNTSYDNSITGFSDSGSSTITLTLTQLDGGTLTTSFSNPQGTVTSVTVSGSSGISGSGTVTTSGSIGLTNSDKGSSQNIFKNIASDSGTAVADNNSDTLSIVGAGSVSTAVVGDVLTITGTDDNENYYVSGASYASGTLTLTRNGLSTLTATGFPTNNNQLTNGSGYTTNTGTTTASNSQTFTNKGGNISQWTNDSGYVTSSGGSMSSNNVGCCPNLLILLYFLSVVSNTPILFNFIKLAGKG